MMDETGLVSWSIHPVMTPKGKGVSQEMGIPGTRNEACTGTEEREPCVWSTADRLLQLEDWVQVKE